MWLSKMGHFEAVTLDFARDRRFIRAIDFSSAVTAPEAAQAGQATPFSFKLASDGDTRNFTAVSADAGGVLRAIGLFDDIVGGRLAIEGRVTPAGKIEGRAEIEDFKLVDAPVVARLLSVAALGGIVDELQGTGISFRVLRVPFTFASSQLGIDDGEMFGNTLGLTMSGSYRFSDSTIDMEGTLVPAYALNSALNFIPVVGDILSGGEKGSGIFAATYRWQGPLATAEPTVNPLAALAPGILRKIFSIFETSPPPAAAREPEPAPPAPGGESSAAPPPAAPRPPA
jgi:hypothetical protein